MPRLPAQALSVCAEFGLACFRLSLLQIFHAPVPLKRFPGRKLATIISSAATRDGMKFTTSSSFAANLPKYKFFSFLYPTMESMVFTAL